MSQVEGQIGRSRANAGQGRVKQEDEDEPVLPKIESSASPIVRVVLLRRPSGLGTTAGKEGGETKELIRRAGPLRARSGAK